jgi:predicted RNA-binding Zn ribbon-like protein
MRPQQRQFQFISGHLALDFVNTVAYRLNPSKFRDYLETAADVTAWAKEARLLETDRIASTQSIARDGISRLLALRERLYRLFRAIALGKLISDRRLELLNNDLLHCRDKQRLSGRDGVVRWDWLKQMNSTDRIFCPVILQTVELLTSGDHSLIKQCDDQDCGWLFLDRSQAKRRKWCSMADCGNRAKARRHYQQFTKQ